MYLHATVFIYKRCTEQTHCSVFVNTLMRKNVAVFVKMLQCLYEQNNSVYNSVSQNASDYNSVYKSVC